MGQCPKPGAQQLILHAELADALHGGGEFAGGGISFALLQRALQRGFGLPAPLLQLEDRQAELAGEELGGLAAQQAQHDLALARRAPTLARRQRARPRRRLNGADRASGQRGRPAPALAVHWPIIRSLAFDFVHAGLHHAALRSDKWVSRETGCSSVVVAVGHSQMWNIVDRVRTLVVEWTLELETAGVLGEGMSFTLTEKEKAASVTNNYFAQNMGVAGDVSGHAQVHNQQVAAAGLDLAKVQDLVTQLREMASILPAGTRDAVAAQLQALAEEFGQARAGGRKAAGPSLVRPGGVRRRGRKPDRQRRG